MIRQVFYTLLIMSFLGALLFFGLYAPPAGKRLVQSVAEFLKWSPPQQEGPLNETEAAIKEFDSSFRTIRNLRSLVVARNKQNSIELEQNFKETRENLKKLLFDMDKQTVGNREQLLTRFNDLHLVRRKLVQNIIEDERSLINLNDQMDKELRTISAWLSEKAANPSSMTHEELTRGQQYENLMNDLKTFVKDTNQLDVLRLVLMRKSEEYVSQLEGSNTKLEESYTTFSSQVQTATSDQADALWAEYERLEKDQREIVKGMKLNQDFIGDNQTKIAGGVSTIGKNITYRSDDQLARFQQNYAQLDAQRAAALNSIQQQQRVLLDSKPAVDALKESNEYRMQRVKEQTQQMLTQYEQIEDYRRSLSSTLESMTDELRDSGQSQIDEAMARNTERMEMIRAKMEAANDRLNNYVQKEAEPLINSPYYIRLKELQDRNKSTLEMLHRGEDQLRNAQERQQSAVASLKDRLNMSKGRAEQARFSQQGQKSTTISRQDRTNNNVKIGVERLDSNDQKQDSGTEALQERIDDVTRRNSEAAESLKQKNESQKQAQKDRIDDQMQRLKDMQQNRY